MNLWICTPIHSCAWDKGLGLFLHICLLYLSCGMGSHCVWNSLLLLGWLGFISVCPDSSTPMLGLKAWVVMHFFFMWCRGCKFRSRLQSKCFCPLSCLPSVHNLLAPQFSFFIFMLYKLYAQHRISYISYTRLKPKQVHRCDKDINTSEV